MWPTTRILIAATIVGSFATTAQAVDKSKSSIIHLYQIGPWIVQSELDPKTDKPFVIVQTPLDSKAGPYLKVNCEEGTLRSEFPARGGTRTKRFRSRFE